MIGIRIGGEVIQIEPEEWNLWVQDGRIPPEAEVWVEGRGWVPAGSLAAWRDAVRTAAAPPESTEPRVREVIFPRRGLSVTEVLLLVNLLVMVVLVVILRDTYRMTVYRWTTGWWHEVHAHGAAWWWVPTLFMHAGPRHILSNMSALLATAGAVEFLMGRRWTVAGYLFTGLAGMALSYYGHGGPPLSIGASGAVFGLGGMTASFLIRRYRRFTYRQRWKARRVYLPLFVALVLPSILNADWMGHLGGFVSGFALGFLVPPHERVRELMAEQRPPAQ